MHAFPYEFSWKDKKKKNSACILRNIASMSVTFNNDKHNNTTEMLNEKEYVEKNLRKFCRKILLAKKHLGRKYLALTYIRL